MDVLNVLINSLDAQESIEFKKFVQRQKFKKERKDLRLFVLHRIEENLTSDQLLKRLELKNLNAYHTLRKRLYAELSEFIMLKTLDEDDSKSARANGYYNLAKHLFQRNIPKLAWKILLKSEKLALQNDLFEILNSIYLLEIEQIHLKKDIDLQEVFQKHSANKRKLELREKVLFSKAQILAEVRRSKLLGKPLDLMPIIQQNLSDFELENELARSPKILLEYLQSLKSVIHISKSYHSLENVIETYFNKMQNKNNAHVNIQILYMLAHTKYRNKKFKESLGIIGEIEHLLSSCSKSFQKEMQLKVIELTSANLMLLGEVENAIATLQPELSSAHNTPKQNSNVIASMGIYHFLKGENAESLRLLHEMKHSEKWYADQMGQEWVMKKNLMEVLLFYELGKMELVESRIRSIERRFKELMEFPEYHKARAFLSLLKVFMLSNKELDLSSFSRQIGGSWEWKSAEEEDLQAMMFYAWLKSKLVGRTFYETMLEVVSIET